MQTYQTKRILPSELYWKLAALPYGKVLSSKVISERQDIHEDFLKKTIQLLSLSSLVSTQRGTQGGVRLAKKADQITIADIVAAIEGRCGYKSLPVSGYFCPNQPKCPVSPVLAGHKKLS